MNRELRDSGYTSLGAHISRGWKETHTVLTVYFISHTAIHLRESCLVARKPRI